MEEKFPNPGEVPKVEEVHVHENNYFKDYDPREVRKKYMEFTVFMTALNQTLCLDKNSGVEQFSARVHDLVMAAAKV